MLNKLAKLINVKSIVTLVLTGVFSYLAITGKIAVDNFTDFLQTVSGKNSMQVFAIIDELMTTLQATNTRLYNAVMRKVDAVE